MTDALAKTTTYHYNEDTNVLEWVQYPNDQDGTETTRTEYTYDEMFRLATAAADVNTGRTLTASYTYTDDMLSSISTGSTTYRFTYGEFGQRTSVMVGNKTLATYKYTQDGNRYLSKLIYGNDDSIQNDPTQNDFIQYEYDDYGRVIQQTYEDGASVTYTYDNTGTLATVMDSATGIKTTYYYDLTDRLVKYTEESSGYSHQITYTYDEKNNLVSMYELAGGRAHPYSYEYDDANRLTRLTYGAGGKIYTYDGYGRLSQRGSIYSEKTTIRENITYTEPASGQTSHQIATWQNVSNSYNVTYSYTYDNNGNITSISDGTNTTSYVYDSANQLLRENNQAGGFTRVWTYDDAGNILSRKEYAYTTGALGTPTDTVTYTYGNGDWGDLLTAYDGETIEYDNVGNPISDGTWTYTWKHGRQLASMTDGTTTISYTYNAEGLRIGKVVTRSNYSETHEYYYNNGNLSCDLITVVDNGVTSNHHLKISYDESGRPLVITYDHKSYYYLLNAQGDVMGLSTVYGVLKVAYTYDAWGNVLSVTGPMADTLGYWNPCRYRGYIYDRETGFYYLQSRYYNPEVGRFINADALVATGQGILGNNTFAYCLNNPIIYCDPTGQLAITTLILIGSAIIGAGCAGYTAYAEYQAGFSTTRIIGDSVCAGFAGFGIAYTGGMSLYQYYQIYCYLNGITPVTEIGSKGVEQQLQVCANTANTSVSGNGAVVGTKKHAVFADEVNKLGNTNLRTEVSYLNGDEVPYGTKGSIRFDVVQYQNGVPIQAWDFKTGSAGLSASRIAAMQNKSGLYNLTILMLK